MKKDEELKTIMEIYNKIGTHFVHINNIIDLLLEDTDKEKADYTRNEIKAISYLVDILVLKLRKKVD